MDKQYQRAGILSLGMLLLVVTSPARALDTQFGEVDVSLGSRVIAGSAWRVENRNPDIVGIYNGGKAYSTNGDDGNLAYDRGDAVAATLKYTADLLLQYRDYGVFLRGTYRYDHVNQNTDYFNEAFYTGAPFYTQTRSDLRQKRSDVRDEIGNKAELLEAFFFGSLELGDRSLSYRLGRQVLNWGESQFIQNGLNSILSLNANRLHAPGFEIAELYEPFGMALVNFDITDSIFVEAFYQWEWRKTEIDASGSYWATNDFAGIGGNAAEIGFGRCAENSAPGVCAFAQGGTSIPRGQDLRPKDGGQYGVAVHFLVPQLNEMDVGLYAANYHSRLPVASGNAAQVPGVAPSGLYRIEYPEDIQLYGISFNTVVADWSFQGEYSLKKDQPLAIDEVELFLAGLRAGLPSQIGNYGPGEFIQGYERFDVSQLEFSAIRIIGPIEPIGSDQLIILAEVGVNYVHDMPSSKDLRLEGPATYLPGDPAVAANPNVNTPVQDGGYADDVSWGYRVAARFEYNNVFNLFNLEPSFLLAHDVKGTSPTPVINFVDGRKQFTASLGIHYLQAWEGGLSYTTYWGGDEFNLLSDRDYVSLFVGYSF